jgi:hypothetical protein
VKNLTFVTIFILFCFGCKKDEFDPNNPNVATFVQQIKNGSYNCYEKDDHGEKLWPIMPKFTEDHIPTLISLSKDTSHVEIFPINPMSSRTPFPEGRQYFILGECLLWTIEGIRNGTEYGSLDPYLIDMTADNPTKGMSGKEILIVRDLYQTWWISNKNLNWKIIYPLEGTSYRWF